MTGVGGGFKTGARRREQVNRARRIRREVARGGAPGAVVEQERATRHLVVCLGGCGRRFPLSTLLDGRLPCDCARAHQSGVFDDTFSTAQSPRLVGAYVAARQARFEGVR